MRRHSSDDKRGVYTSVATSDDSGGGRSQPPTPSKKRKTRILDNGDDTSSVSLSPTRTPSSTATTCTPVKVAFTLLYAMFICTNSILTKSTAGDDHKFRFTVSTAVFLTEAIKWTISICGIAYTHSTARCSKLNIQATSRPPSSRIHFPLSTMCTLVCISLGYAVWNTLRYVILEYIDPATLFLVHNLKIVFTAIFMRVIMRKVLSISQWIAIFGLTAGVCLSQVGHVGDQGGGGGGGEEESDTTTAPLSYIAVGIGLAFFRAVGTAATNVFCESVYKKHTHAFWYLNATLYTFGMLFNFLFLCIAALDVFGDLPEATSAREAWKKGFFHDYSFAVALIILLGGLSGFFVSVIFKYIDNIALLAADVIAMVILVGVSVRFFDLQVDGFLVTGCVLVLVSLSTYYAIDLTNARALRAAHSANDTKAAVVFERVAVKAKDERDEDIEMKPAVEGVPFRGMGSSSSEEEGDGGDA
eukprot:g757.t1